MRLTRALGPVLMLALAGCASSEVSRTATEPSVRPSSSTTQGAASTTSSERQDATSGSLCVPYSVSAVAERSFAFDGIVRAVGEGTTNKPGRGDLDTVAVTFDVTEWFRGGDGQTVTVDMTPAAEPAVGQRLLVSGEPRWGGEPLQDAIAWGGAGECAGFTRDYDEAAATEWRTATSQRWEREASEAMGR